MNIYFACSITGGRAFESAYQGITRALLEDGHEVPTALLAESNIIALEKVIEPREVYDRDLAWLCACDVLIAEVSVPSHGVGYEIGYVLSQEKPVLCLAKEGVPVSKMITGNSHPSLQVKYYGGVTEGIAFVRSYIANIVCE